MLLLVWFVTSYIFVKYFSLFYIDVSKKSPFRTFNNDNMRNSRVSPTESTFEFVERTPKFSFNAHRRKGSGSSSSLCSFRGGKVS